MLSNRLIFSYVYFERFLKLVFIFLRKIILISFEANANGSVLLSEIVGAVKMRVFLTGMPELRLGLNDKVLFESSGRMGLKFILKKKWKSVVMIF